MTIPKGSVSVSESFYVPGDEDIEIEELSITEDDFYYYR
jgi:hypothetical protein